MPGGREGVAGRRRWLVREPRLITPRKDILVVGLCTLLGVMFAFGWACLCYGYLKFASLLGTQFDEAAQRS